MNLTCLCVTVSGTNGLEFDMNLLKPILDGVDGFYQIGPSEKCAEKFVLSVTVAFAANLLQVRYIPTFFNLLNYIYIWFNPNHTESHQL